MGEALYLFGKIIIHLHETVVCFINKIVDKLCNVEDSSDLYKCYFLFEKGIRGYDKRIEKVYNMLDLVVDFINESKISIDMCFYLITDISIVNALVDAKDRNVTVRVVTDYSSGVLNNKYAKLFYKAGIPVYVRQTNPGRTIMHHKFAIRDGTTVLQCSMNLTKNTTKGSYDNMMITREEDIVQPCINHFQTLMTVFRRAIF